MWLYVVAGTEAGANQYVYDPAQSVRWGFNSGAVPYRYDAVLFDAVTRKIGLDAGCRHPPCLYRRVGA